MFIYIYVYAGVVHYFALPLSLFLDAQSSSYRIVWQAFSTIALSILSTPRTQISCTSFVASESVVDL